MPKFGLASGSVAPNGADSVNDVSSRELVSRRDLGLARATTGEFETFKYKASTGSPMDRPIDAPAAK